MSLMVSISGIRGIIGESLTPDVIVKYISGFADYCGRGTVVIGRDGRCTGDAVAKIVSSTLIQMGCNVVDIGVCPTPTVAIAVEQEHAAGGIIITASHNPMQWNGLKFLASTGLFLDAAENQEFWTIAGEASRRYVPWDKQGTYRYEPSYIQKHIDAILSIPSVHVDEIRAKKFKVVVDCVNAAGGVIVPELLRRLGCEIIEMNCDVSGVFSHTPEPIPENLTSLAERVKAEGAQLGIAVDPDVDRLVLINEKGEPFVEEYTVTSAVRFVLEEEQKHGRTGHTVVVNLSTTRAVDDVAARYGARVLRTSVGEINVASCMRDTNAIVGGEGSGGVILPAVHLGRDAIVGIGVFLQLLTNFGGAASALKADLPQYHIVKNKIALGSLRPDEILGRIKEKYERSEKITTLDGLKIDFASSWVHLRKSNTEPIIRIIAEARTTEEAAALVSRFQQEISA
ncbi:MAG TPA: phosphoglucosamine mutase [Bacteroidota bacterium]|nr:phosphoglucosamine mutase [Bacteroidota bacterium]